jgi:hypothetical protein
MSSSTTINEWPISEFHGEVDSIQTSGRCFKQIWKVGKVGEVGKVGKVGKLGKVGREGSIMPTWNQL